MRILEWIACTFGLRVTLFGTMLTLYSCERMQDAAGGAYPEVHYGADETVSVNRECDTCAVHVNNYALPGIPVDFDLSTGTLKLDVQPLPMRIRQGRAFYGYQTGNWHTYIRQLYEFQEGQKDWNLNKYSSAGVKVDEFDESQYIVGGVPLAGAYPVAVLRDGEGTYRSYIWLKGHNNGASITDPLLSCYLPNFITTPNTFFVFSLQGMMAMHYGNVNGWEYPGNAGFTRRFNADDNATYSANYDECAVPIDPYSSISSDVATDTGLAMRIKYKKQDGTVLYWYGETYEWLSTEFPNYLSLVDAGGSGEALSEFRFGALGFKTFFHWESPHYKDGTKAVFYNEEIPDYSVWFYLPSTIGDLTIEFSIPANGNRPWQMYNFLLLSDSMTFRMLEAIESLEEVDLSACDVIYSNSESETVDAEETFYIYSENDYGGRGMLYRDTSDSPVDTLTYPYGSEKPEWNYIALMTQLYSRCQVNRDIISINDFRLLYADRFVNSASIDVLTGLVRVSTVKPDSYTLTPVS
jgi:hypothetical protein